jgi:hypothetical protein
VNFRTEATSANRFFIQTTPVNESFEISVNQRTGFALTLHSTHLSALFHKGFRDALVSISVDIGQFDMSVLINSAVVTYERLNHRISLYLNGIFRSSVVAKPDFVDDVIDWSTSDNLYVNRFFTYSPFQPAHYHKISVYDKVLTLEEVVDIYNASQS